MQALFQGAAVPFHRRPADHVGIHFQAEDGIQSRCSVLVPQALQMRFTLAGNSCRKSPA